MEVTNKDPIQFKAHSKVEPIINNAWVTKKQRLNSPRHSVKQNNIGLWKGDKMTPYDILLD